MVRRAVQQALAAVTVRWVGTPQWVISLGLEQTTVWLAMLADTAQEAAHRVLAAATVRWVGTPLSEALVLDQTTA